MLTTTRFDPNATVTLGHQPSDGSGITALAAEYDRMLSEKRLAWTSYHRLIRRLGEGGQGVVYLSERRGADEFTVPVAIKVFSPSRYDDEKSYELAMGRIASVAARVAQIQHEHLLDVHNFVERHRIRMMVMEWVDGYDVQRLLNHELLERIRERVSTRRWEYLNRVVVTAGPVHARLKAGVAMAVVRECLGALAALHREGIVHGDIKPSNIMLKCTGHAKIVDIGSAFEVDDPPVPRTVTPVYAAPEVLEGGQYTPRSDLASLGYVLIEMLSGRPVFAGISSLRDLLTAKRELPRRLEEFLPEEVTVNELLMNFCRGLIAPDPMRRFPNAEDANLREGGAAAFHRQLILSNLASEYDNEIRLWLQELKEMEEG